jgi:hypothetical protein
MRRAGYRRQRLQAHRTHFGQNTRLARFRRRSPGESIAEILSELTQGTEIASLEEDSFHSSQETPEIPAQVPQRLKEDLDSNRSELREDHLTMSVILDSSSPKSFHYLRPYLLFPHESALSA